MKSLPFAKTDKIDRSVANFFKKVKSKENLRSGLQHEYGNAMSSSCCWKTAVGA